MPVLRPLLVLVPAVLCGCSVSGTVEDQIERALPRAIGPAESYDVTVDGLRARTSEAEAVRAVGRRVRPEGAPVLERLDLDLWGVRYDRGERRLERVDSARAAARVLPADLSAFLEARRGVRDVSIRLVPPDTAVVRVRPEVGNLALPRGVAAEVDGRLVAVDGRVHLEVLALRAVGLDLGRTAARRLSDQINPVVDLSETRPALRVTRVRVEDGGIVLVAEGDLTGLRLD